jgi:tetratricopeptide (TPR) repeat protein
MTLVSKKLPVMRKWAAVLTLLAVAACAGPESATRSDPASKKKSPRGIDRPSDGTADPEGGGPVQVAIRRSLSYLEQGKAAAAQALLEETAASHAEAGKLHNALGVVYKHQGRTEEAIKAYKKAIELREGHVEAYYNLGILYREQGHFKEAEKQYRHALFLKPDFAHAHYNLGVLYDLYLDNPAGALNHYKEYKRSGGKDDDVDIWIRDLERRAGGGNSPPPPGTMEEVP